MHREMTQAREDAVDTEALRAVGQIGAINGILQILCTHTRMRVGAVARVTQDAWQALAVHNELGRGLAVGDYLDVDTTLCKLVRDECAVLTINDVRSDTDFITRSPPDVQGFRSYAAAPILLADGSFFGTLCTFDPRPTNVEDPTLVGMFLAYAALIGHMLDAELEVSRTRENLGRERRLGAAREQFMAVVAHDLRNPLSAAAGIGYLLARTADERTRSLGERLQGITARMSGLVDDLTDHARGQSGSGIPVSLALETNLSAKLEAVVEETRAARPGREIRSSFQFSAVECDAGRMQQTLSNLLANAIAYGSPDDPAVVEGFCTDGQAVLIVTNWGSVIPETQLSQVFDPYWRGLDDQGHSHMGLGLHICQQIAKAHRGVISVASSAEMGTRFEVRWPTGLATDGGS